MSDRLKICVISFDNWHYDKQIINALNKRNISANHINIGNFKHKNNYERIKNTISKIFFNKNLKLKKRQEYILESLQKLGKQDQILVINPDLIEKECHLDIKKYTNRYIAYLYDSIARSMFPIEHLLEGVFDDIFSFDLEDVQKYNLKKTYNFIYLEKKPNIPNSNTKYKILTVASLDKRFELLNKIAHKLTDKNICFKFIIISKNIQFKKIKLNNIFKKTDINKINKQIVFQSKKINLKKLNVLYNETLVILDLVQDKQTGLSFRVFEAMGLQKKLITNNKTIKNYTFYNPNNILVIDDTNIDSSAFFLTTPYEPIPNEIYQQYTIETWVEKIFQLKVEN